jgi:pimeloyl-ACP methyl ester carboxylesterase
LSVVRATFDDVRILDVASAPAGAPPCRLRVRCWDGPGDSVGPPFVLVHGLSSNARLWDEVAAVLVGAGHDVAAVDLRSHGESESPARGYDTATAAADVAAVAAAIFAAPVIAVGQSWGGNVVVRFAAKYPERVVGVGLVDGGWLDLTTAFDSWQACAAALRPPDVDGLPADALRRRIAADHPGWSPAAVAATMANLREQPDGTLVRRLSIPDHMRIVRSMWEDPPWPDLTAIMAPALLLPALPAGRSGADKRALVERAAAMLHRARVREYVGGDHDLHAQQPAAVAADLLTLAAQARGGGIDGGAAGHYGVGRDDANDDKATSFNLGTGG